MYFNAAVYSGDISSGGGDSEVSEMSRYEPPIATLGPIIIVPISHTEPKAPKKCAGSFFQKVTKR